jgi:steroid delta-isomerase-like uncharacterized protein
MKNLTLMSLILLAVTASAKANSKTHGIVERVYAAWSAHDPEKVLGFYTDDVVYDDVPLGQVNRGKAELRKLVEETFTAFPDLKVQLVSYSICKGHGTSEVIWSGTDKGYWKTNKQFSVRMLSTFELRGGKFSRTEDFYDLATIMRQVGVLPADGANEQAAGR